jgi:hypothetical protein
MPKWSWPRLAAVYMGAAVALTWPLAIQLRTHLGALEGPGDPFLNLWVLGWGMHAWTTDPLGVLAGHAFDANIFHPAPGTLTYSDHLLLQSLVLAPVWALTEDATAAYNLLLLSSIAASGLAMHVFVRGVTGSDAGALVAGLAWACWPYRTAHLVHLQLQALYFLPLALLALHRLAAARRARDAIGLAVCAALQAISSVYYGVMTAAALAAAGLALAWSTGQWRARRFWTRILMAAALGAVLVGPGVVPYWRTAAREGFGRNFEEAARHAAALDSYFQVPPTNLLYGRTGLLAPRAPQPGSRDLTDPENQLFPGFLLVGLAAYGAWRARRRDQGPLAVAGAALVGSGFLLSLGPEGAGPLYRAAAEAIFGFQAIRAPARFAVVAMAGLCALAGAGASRFERRPGLTAVLVAGLLAEYANAPLPLAEAPPRTTLVGAWLRGAPEPGSVLYLPLTIDRDNTPFMVESLQHFRPIVNGYSGQRPSFFTTLVDALADPTSADARALLRELDVRYVVSPQPLAGAGTAESPLVERARPPGATIYELVWTEASVAAIGEVGAPEPPAPGPLPFGAGETATYEAEWVGGPLDLPAGTIVLSAQPVGQETGQTPTAAWIFEATAETAPWVSRFFEAQDRFRTVADAEIKPLVHARSLREGRRRLDRVYLFDAAARRVRSGEDLTAARDPAALALPLAPGARDALTVCWYVRTIPLEPGTTLELPVNEAGRSLRLRLTAGEREHVPTPAGSVDALRVEARVVERVPRRRPVEATVWLSTDARRQVVAAEVSATFGRVRVKLVDYRP